MSRILSKAKTFIQSEDGPTATEYAVMLALIIVVCIAAISSLGTKVSQIFSAVDGTMTVSGGS